LESLEGFPAVEELDSDLESELPLGVLEPELLFDSGLSLFDSGLSLFDSGLSLFDDEFSDDELSEESVDLRA
jgi:hypothetical protein